MEKLRTFDLFLTLFLVAGQVLGQPNQKCGSNLLKIGIPGSRRSQGRNEKRKEKKKLSGLKTASENEFQEYNDASSVSF